MLRYLSKSFLALGLLLCPASALSIVSITTPAAFESALTHNQYVLVDFFMTTCGPCNALAPILEQIQASLPQVTFFKVNIMDRAVAGVSEKYHVRAVPTLIIFKNGIEIGRIIGNNKTASELVDSINTMLQS